MFLFHKFFNQGPGEGCLDSWVWVLNVGNLGKGKKLNLLNLMKSPFWFKHLTLNSHLKLVLDVCYSVKIQVCRRLEGMGNKEKWKIGSNCRTSFPPCHARLASRFTRYSECSSCCCIHFVLFVPNSNLGRLFLTLLVLFLTSIRTVSFPLNVSKL
jgi:hypothetical protein